MIIQSIDKDFPYTIPGLVRWYDAHDINGDGTQLSDSTALSSWRDKSLYRSSLSQGTGAHQPQYKTANLNGLGGVYFNGGNFMSGSFLFSNTFTYFFVVQGNSQSDKYFTWMGQGGGGISGEGTNYDSTNVRLDQNRPSWVNRLTTATTTNPVIVRCVGSDGFSAIQVNTNTEASNTTAGSCSFVGNGYYIGGRGGLFNNFTGTIGEIMRFHRTLTATETLKIQRYLANKWGIDID